MERNSSSATATRRRGRPSPESEGLLRARRRALFRPHLPPCFSAPSSAPLCSLFRAPFPPLPPPFLPVPPASLSRPAPSRFESRCLALFTYTAHTEGLYRYMRYTHAHSSPLPDSLFSPPSLAPPLPPTSPTPSISRPHLPPPSLTLLSGTRLQPLISRPPRHSRRGVFSRLLACIGPSRIGAVCAPQAQWEPQLGAGPLLLDIDNDSDLTWAR